MLFSLVLMISLSMVDSKAQSGRRFRDIVAEKYPDSTLYIGSASHRHLLNTSTADILTREFSYVTPANKFKQNYIHPDPEIWRWEDSDYWVDFAASNNQVMRLHAPISPQCSKWVKNDERTAAELKQMLEEYMTELCKRYNDYDHIKWLDVVNETVNPDGSWKGPKEGVDKWENPWPQIGYDDDPNNTPLYIKYAFEIADSLAPDLKLIINQHGSMQTAMWDKIKETVMYLREQGLRVDGIGWQAHIEAGWEKKGNNPEKLQSLIEWAHSHDLEFHITENNSWLEKWEYDEPEERQENFEKQGETFAALVRTLLPYRKTGVVSWNLWHIKDDECQGYKLWDRNGCMWTTEGTPKPAYYMVQTVLERGLDSARHDVTFRIKDADTRKPLNDCDLTFDGKTYRLSGKDSLSISGILAGSYPLEIHSDHYSSYKKDHLCIYKDSVITLELEKEEYKLSLHVMNEDTKEGISAVEIKNNKLLGETNYEGNALFYLPWGTHNLSFEKTGYSRVEKKINLSSDTSLKVSLHQTHADVKFRVKHQEIPVHDARIIFTNDTLETNSLGIASFKNVPVDREYEYSVNKPDFQSDTGRIYLRRDTTVNLELDKPIADVEFVVSQENQSIENATVIFNRDSLLTDKKGTATFRDVKIDTTYAYKIKKPGFQMVEDSLYVKKDSSLSVELQPTGIRDQSKPDNIQVYPNPAKDKLLIKSQGEINFLAIYDIRGELMMAKRKRFERKFTVSVSSLDPGIYLLVLNGKNKISVRINIIK